VIRGTKTYIGNIGLHDVEWENRRAEM